MLIDRGSQAVVVDVKLHSYLEVVFPSTGINWWPPPCTWRWHSQVSVYSMWSRLIVIKNPLITFRILLLGHDDFGPSTDMYSD